MQKRPQYHITGLKNWINDPNGLINYKGKYHIFFQHHPYSLIWGPMHWGHVISYDLLNFKHLPIALTPGDEFDKDGCFSGTAIEHEDKLYLFYTGFINNENPAKVVQQQCMAVSNDGINFKKNGTIIDKANLPSDFAPNDFRDPCVFKDGDTFVMLVAAKRKNGRGNILKYKSQNLYDWDYVDYILPNDSKGSMVECPDYVKDLNLLIYCEQFQPKEKYKHRNVHSTFYHIGHFVDNKFVSKHSGTLDYGFDFYAPQVIKGDNILIAWMNMWDRNNPSEKYGFTGCLTIPRKLSIKNGELYQEPIMSSKLVKKVENTHYKDDVIVGFFKIEIYELKTFSLKLRKGLKNETAFVLKNNEWIFNRSNAGTKIVGKEVDDDSTNGIRRMPYIYKDKHIIYIVLDVFSVEIFVDGKSLSSQIFPLEDSSVFELSVDANKCILEKFE